MRRSILASLLLVACSDYGFTPDGVWGTGADDPAQQRADDDTAPDGGQDSGSTPQDTDSATPDDTDDPVQPQAGCADGEREGFLSWDDYPQIAACSGAWSVAGVTRDDLVPTCGRGGGDDSSNVDGEGCSAADLCAEGWHVCDGAAQVGSLAGSCDDAVPDGTPDKSLFFAVQQPSDSDSVCDDGASRGNDVFGCGNLGTQLGSDKQCGALNRVLASMNPNTCGFNEAEPGLGPWECLGGDDSHYHEGELVTKKGCPGGSCSYDGYSVGSSDKGGVVCCAD